MDFLIPVVVVILGLGTLMVFINWFWSENGFSRWFTGKDLEEATAVEVLPTPELRRERPKKISKVGHFTEDVGVTTMTYTFKDGSTMDRVIHGEMMEVFGFDYASDAWTRYNQTGYFQHLKVTSEEAAMGLLARERESGFIYWPDMSRMRLFEDFDHVDFKTESHTVSFSEVHYLREREGESLPDAT